MTRQIIRLSAAAFNAIADELIKSGCEEAVILEADRTVRLDMHGICLLRKVEDLIDLPQCRAADAVEFLKGFE